MAERTRVFTIPAHRSFVDALAAGLLAAGDRTALARTTVLLPNRRAVRALTEVFVRAAGGGLLLPRMLPIGDVGEDEALGLFDDLLALETDLPPAVGAFERRMLLMPLISRWQRHAGRPGSAVETLRLADALARTLDQLQLEGVDPAALEDAGSELGLQWQATAGFLRIIVKAWPRILKADGRIDRTARRQKLLRAIAGRWRHVPPAYPIIAAGMAGGDPAVAALLAAIVTLPMGAVVLPGLDLATGDWDALPGFPTHPQASMRQLLDRMGVARGEVAVWQTMSDRDGPEDRSIAIAAALALPESTARWPASVDFAGLQSVEAANPAEEQIQFWLYSSVKMLRPL